MTQCTSTHSKCKSMTPRILPTQLIDLGELGANTIRPKLQESKDELELDTQYVTLSYCWGGLVPLRLMKDNYQSLLSEIAASTIPQLFRKAMEVAYRLKIRYIWIDELCIIQDSPSDWANECTIMGQIYECGNFNIVAKHALSSAGTLFYPRPPLSVESCRTTARYFNTEDQEQTKKYSESGEYFITYLNGRSQGQESILDSRSWIMQEMMLARRNVVFQADMVCWDCKECRASESLRKNMTSIDLSHNNDVIRAQKGRDSFTLWNTIIEQYSRLSFTFPEKDRLAALAGIARKHGDPENYRAGFWKDVSALQLFWSVVPDSRSLEKAQDSAAISPSRATPAYQATSWSWASVNSPKYVWDPSNQLAQFMIAGWQVDTILFRSRSVWACIKWYLPSTSTDLQIQIRRRWYERIEDAL